MSTASNIESKVGLLGKKVGMTRIYDKDGVARAVTVVDVQGNHILQLKKKETDGYNAVQLGFDDQKEQRTTKAQLGHFAKSYSKPKRFQREFRLSDGMEPSDLPKLGEWSISNFKEGECIDVISNSKGKGFQGVVHRWGFSGQNQTHGSMMHRRPGSIGNSATPGRVWKNKKMPGHQGDRRVTIQNLEILQIRPEDGILLISGAIPGAKGSYVIIRPAKKKSSKNSLAVKE